MKYNSIFTKSFIICFMGTFILYCSIYFLIPILPLYLEDMGKDRSEIGVIIGAFSASSIILRPLVGALLDTYSKKSLMILGALIFAVSPFLYLTTTSGFWLSFIRFFHGIGVATFATSAVVMVSNVVPRERLAYATGIYVISVSASFGIAPLLGSMARKAFSFSGQMTALVLAALVILLLVAGLEEPALPKDHSQKQSLWEVLKDRNVWAPSLVFTTCSFTIGTIMAFLPLYVLTLGENSTGLFFMIYSATLVAVRLVGGGLSDSFGRGAVIVPSLGITFLGTVFLALVNSPAGLLLDAFLYATGVSLVYPTLNALVVERAAPENRGTALGIFSASVDGGFFLGSATMGYIAHYFGFREMFVAASLLPLGGLVVFLWLQRVTKKQNAGIKVQMIRK